jgi:hypothetical protein
MKPVFTHRAALVLATAATVMLTGCAGAPQNENLATLGGASTALTDAPAEITGSRIPVRRTDKMVSQIGSRDYKENRDALAAPLRTN